jgi:hypothetical protein
MNKNPKPQSKKEGGVSMIPELPNMLFSTGRSVLSKFGYVHLEEGHMRDDWAEMWEHLRSDFPIAASQIPSYDLMDAVLQSGARQYMSIRLLADHYLDECERLHVQIYQGRIETGLVEAYSQARDRYEHSVDEFGEARLLVQNLLNKKAA